jgi:sodium pump decarboxylase gamma subunit
MNKRSLGLFLALLMAVSSYTFGQTAGLCINEVMTNNKTNIVDEYGEHHPWIEIFNSTFNSIDISSCYITTHKEIVTEINKRNVRKFLGVMYHIPKGDATNLIGPRQFKVYFADGQARKGNLHTNFMLDSIHSNWIGLYDANGYTLIDSITVPPMQADWSYALAIDGILNKPVIMKSGATPGVNNVTLDQDSKVRRFKESDPIGISMTIIAMGVVFFALILLYLAFKFTGKIGADMTRKNAMKARGISTKEEAAKHAIGDESGDVFAAIAMALHEYQSNIHDVEDLQLTMSKVKKNYSPWSSKIYMLRHAPKR